LLVIIYNYTNDARTHESLAVLELAYYILVTNNHLFDAISVDLRLYIDAVSNEKDNLYLWIRW